MKGLYENLTWKKFQELKSKIEGTDFDFAPGSFAVEKTAKVEVVAVVSVRIDEHGGRFAVLTENGDNLSAEPYDEYGYYDTVEKASRNAVENCGDRLDLRSGTFTSVTTTGGEDIDGTYSVEVLDRRDWTEGEDDVLYCH